MAEPSLAAAARAYYGGRDVASAVREALRGAHGERDRFTPAELAGLDQLHTWGPAGTTRLAEMAGVRAEDRVLDLGGGLGGAARQLAASTGCHVTLVDLTPQLCGAAELLNRLTGLDDRVEVLCGDVLDPPVDRGAFDVAWLQHVTMHIPDTGRLMASARRALAPAGRLALWEVTAGPGGPPHLPAPWGDRPEGQHLAAADDLCAAAEAVGLRRVVWQDLSADLVVRMRAAAAMGLRPPGPGFEVFLSDWADRQDNHLRNLAEDRIRLVMGVFALPSDDPV